MRADPADPRDLERLLVRHRLRLRHELGQHFLVDPALRDAIADAALLAPADEAMEVGAGVGTLTVRLAGRCRRLVAVELDERLATVLAAVLGDRPGVEIVRADILRLDLDSLFPGGGEVVVGNIPYYLTGALVQRLLDRESRPRRLALVVQADVARRWTSPGDWSLASVAVQVFAEPRLALTLPAAAFRPSPAVDSALVVMEVRDHPAVDIDDVAGFLRLVEAVFQQRRKQLGTSLGRITGLGLEAAARLREIGIDPVRRPQTLSLAEWSAVHVAVKRLR
ncbi:MAG: 16S rRNA (adenine(1518)-N(6)/adenine(1519)-N(6))-dimethyltransferase RsmA [Candidatus Dormibacteraceae bacterium]